MCELSGMSFNLPVRPNISFRGFRQRGENNPHGWGIELNGKEHVFAHNGTIENYRRLKLGRFKPIGETDSEYVFCHLLNYIEKRCITEWKKEDFEWLVEKLWEINGNGNFKDGMIVYSNYRDVSKRLEKGFTS